MLEGSPDKNKILVVNVNKGKYDSAQKKAFPKKLLKSKIPYLIHH